jgi:hypothetical protein
VRIADAHAETAERIAAWISRSMDDADAAPPAAN